MPVILPLRPKHERAHLSMSWASHSNVVASLASMAIIRTMINTLTIQLRCIGCGKTFSEDEVRYYCADCGPRQGNLEVLYDLDTIKRSFNPESLKSNKEPSIWRYLPMLPLSGGFIQPIQIGGTPLYEFEDVGKDYGVKSLFIKDDGKNATASYKDRASAVVIIKAQEKGLPTVTCASTGNAASSMAGYAAATDLNSIIFVPASAPEAKVTQLLIYGSTVFAVDGSYDDAFDLCTEAATKFDWYNRSAGMNPYLVEGKKTGAWEIAEQMNWDVPDVVLVSVGDGSVISGVVKGFLEMHKMDFIPKVPKVIGVQAEHSAPLAKAFPQSTEDHVVLEDLTDAHTIADSIEVGFPRDGIKAIKYLKKVNGDFVVVTDDDILDAIKIMARSTGVFGEPAGAATFAGFVKLCEQGKLNANDRVALVISGNGLKDIAAARKAAQAEANQIPCSLEAVQKVMEKLS